MLVALDGKPLTVARTGVGHYTFELARELARVAPSDLFKLVSPRPFPDAENSLGDESANLRWVHPFTSFLREYWWTLGLPLYLAQSRPALFHGTNFDIPVWGGCPCAVTIHDLSTLLMPQMHRAELARRARRRLPLVVRRAARIITPTESVKREVCEHLSVDPGKIIVIPEAPRSVFRPLPPDACAGVRNRLGIEHPFLLFVGTIEPRKNLLALIRAFLEVLPSTEVKAQLVIAGMTGWLTDELFEYVRASGAAERIRFTGYLPDTDLGALYSSCCIFIYPSLYEGFGLPPLEAMSCGAPVIASRIPSIVETVGNAARLIEPTDVNELARAITDLWADEEQRQRLASAGRERASLFSWERTARLTLQVYTDLAAIGRLRGARRDLSSLA